ncbi:GNAT family N-acetyltransferase [Conexibacter sp. SYSU D00693]|uniref:GNAT family N-acetyltransferase n=1 Tax=Conexibacter sp. SYSU D00693 TaxID=2812560 RepID=UPI00196B8A9B|nr:GNAT family N-acetyltransferase [Conexibacter sp. SYSU D00693]
MAAPSDLVVRPLAEEDVPAAERVGWEALRALWPPEFVPPDDELRASRGQLRMRHLRATDPDGCFVAEVEGRIAGVALSLLREDVWGLSLLGVHPDFQGRGVGAAVLAPALDHGAGARGGIIAASTDARALKRYVRAGFDALPCLSAAGALNASRIPDGLRARPGDVEADRATLDAASRQARGASHAVDLPAIIAMGGRLLVHEDRGFAVERDGAPVLLAALDDEAATDLLWSCFAQAAPGQSVHVDFIPHANDWALRTALDAGLSLGHEGPIFVRGSTGTFRSYLLSGAFL